MKIRKRLGIGACVLLIVSCFLSWTWYPDIEKYFSGFFSEGNYYGKPGKLLCFFAITGIACYFIEKEWTKRLNLIFGGLCVGYALTTFLRFSASYDGFVPEKQFGIYLMLFSATLHILMAALASAGRMVQVPVNKELNAEVDEK